MLDSKMLHMPTAKSETLRQLDAINDWLQDIFGKGMRLSKLLAKAGLSESQIENIKTHHLTEFIQSVLNLIVELDESDESRQVPMMQRFYGLINGTPETLQTIGDSVGLSRERVRQLIKKPIQRYRHPKRKERLIAGLVKLAQDLLNNRNLNQE
jgi:DNA-directed RNA polymerase sigma subunit (sigma70/sigma32)